MSLYTSKLSFVKRSGRNNNRKRQRKADRTVDLTSYANEQNYIINRGRKQMRGAEGNLTPVLSASDTSDAVFGAEK